MAKVRRAPSGNFEEIPGGDVESVRATAGGLSEPDTITPETPASGAVLIDLPNIKIRGNNTAINSPAPSWAAGDFSTLLGRRSSAPGTPANYLNIDGVIEGQTLERRLALGAFALEESATQIAQVAHYSALETFPPEAIISKDPTHPAASRRFVSDRTPVGTITGNPGDVCIVSNGATTDVYLHKGASADDSSWIPLRARDRAFIDTPAIFSTTSGSFQVAQTLNFTPSAPGDYRLSWYSVFQMNTVGASASLEARHGAAVLGAARQGFEVDITDFSEFSGEAILESIPATPQTFTINCSSNGVAELSVSNRRLMIERW